MVGGLGPEGWREGRGNSRVVGGICSEYNKGINLVCSEDDFIGDAEHNYNKIEIHVILVYFYECFTLILCV